MPIINGRHPKVRNLNSEYVTSITPGIIRVDDKNNLDFWLEIALTKEEWENLKPYEISLDHVI